MFFRPSTTPSPWSSLPRCIPILNRGTDFSPSRARSRSFSPSSLSGYDVNSKRACDQQLLPPPPTRNDKAGAGQDCTRAPVHRGAPRAGKRPEITGNRSIGTGGPVGRGRGSWPKRATPSRQRGRYILL